MYQKIVLTVFLGLSFGIHSGARANDLICTIQHVQAGTDGTPQIDTDIRGSVILRNYDQSAATYRLDLNANGTKKSMDFVAVTAGAGVTNAYTSTTTQSVAGQTVTVTSTFNVMNDKTFVLHADVTSDVFPDTFETDTGVCN